MADEIKLGDVLGDLAVLGEIVSSIHPSEAELFISVKSHPRGGTDVEITPGMYVEVCGMAFDQRYGLSLIVRNVDEPSEEGSLSVEDVADVLPSFTATVASKMMKEELKTAHALLEFNTVMMKACGNRKLVADKFNRVIDGNLQVSPGGKVSPADRKYYGFYDNEDEVGIY